MANKNAASAKNKNAKAPMNKNKILIIVMLAAAVIAIAGIVISIAVANRGPADNASLVDLKTNGLHELIFVMSDGSEVNAGALPSNHEGVEIISATFNGVVAGTTGAHNKIRIVCSDDMNRDYTLEWNIPKFGEGCSLRNAKINSKGELVFYTKENGVNKTVTHGLIMKLSTPAPKDRLTPDGASEYAESLTGAELVYVEISIKDYGKVTLALDKTAAPKTVEAFLSLVERDYYNGLTFNKILDAEKYGDSASYVLGGISSADAPRVEGEFAENGYSGNYLSHKYGTVSLYHRENDEDGATSEFFICTADNTSLDGKYAAFGFVVSGMNIIEQIAEYTGTFSESDGILSSQLSTYRAKQAVIESITVKE